MSRENITRLDLDDNGVLYAQDDKGRGWSSNSGNTTDPDTRRLGQAIKSALVDGRSLGLAWLSDSTADGTTDWAWLLGTMLGQAFPNYTVRGAVFSDTNQAYPPPTIIQGSDTSRFVRFVTASSHSLEIQNADIASAPADIDLAIEVSLDDWTPSVANTLAAHAGAGGNRSWEFIVNTNGKLGFSFSTDGTNFTTIQSSVATGFSDGSIQWVRVQFQHDDGGGNHVTKFYTSSDGQTWAQLGTTSTVSGTIALFASTYQWELGARFVNTQVCTGNFYRVRFLSGLDTQTVYGSVPVIAPVFPEWWGQIDSSSPSPSGNPVLELSLGCVGGKGLSYLSDTTRVKVMLPDCNHRAVFMATSHNDSDLIGPNYLANWATWITNVKAQAWAAVPVVVTENPVVAPRAVDNDVQRRWLQIGLAARLGLPAIDAYAAFLDANGRVMSQYLAADGEHPTATGPGDGMHLWAAAAYSNLFGN